MTRRIGGQSEPAFQTYSLEPLAEGYPVGAGEKLILELDAGELVTAFPFLEMEARSGPK
ncbi:hypothetical protein [Cohnella faecalis]|uniref:hypothetical protein n=1 Tax=Cohnella faecalis TaxID=2315694 RepID=UPI0013143C45|nr:hypothetical protein [Cohnella faecalis]